MNERGLIDRVLGRWREPTFRRHRFVSESGDAPDHYRNLPLSFWTWALGKLHSGYRPDLPWLPIDAIRWLEANLTQSSRVLEVGAGRSTFFFAKRVAAVTSLEPSAEWRCRVRRWLSTAGMANVTLPELDDRGVAAAAASGLSSSDWDVVLLDADPREQVLEPILDWLRPSAALLVDNWDRFHYAEARRRLRPHRVFTDFSTFNFSVSAAALFIGS